MREAVDFLRHYAGEAERSVRPVVLPGQRQGVTHGVTGETNQLRLVACASGSATSPGTFRWRFIGQVASALATCNEVLAKPAEQTPGVAWEEVKLLRQAERCLHRRAK